MNHKPNDNLEQELQAAGADPGLARELVALAGQVSQLKGREPKPLTPKSLTKRRPRIFAPLTILVATAGLALGVVLVAFSQTSYPGNVLYPVKRASESLAVSVAPDYRGTLMMRRAGEVKHLVARHHDARLVMTALAEYKVEVAAYKTNNYATLEYCKSNLQQAETMAQGQEHQAIADTLASVKSED